MTATARKQASQPRYTTYLRKTIRSPHILGSRPGYDFEVTDESTGLVVSYGWTSGTKRDASNAAKQAIRELEGNP